MNQHASPVRHPDVDVLIVGAGLSGIDAAYHMKTRRPDQSFAVIESKDEIGGTWATHRFPGIRSDSDLYTFGFDWKPWMGPAIATADEIMAYLQEAVDEQELRPHIRFGQTVRQATWDSATALWTLHLDTADGARTLTCRFLWLCPGYYRHGEAYVPDFPGRKDFAGLVIHPQFWPDDLDLTDKAVTVIGSGATAATLIPAIAGTARHVTMLQRSPTYYFPRPKSDEFTDTLRALDLPQEWFHEIMRRRHLQENRRVTRLARTAPDTLKADLLAAVRAYLGDEADIETDFTPHYRPWQQRVAMIPEGDLFRAIRSGAASVVTDTIERFTESGIRLTSGRELQSDVIVTATGLVLNTLGDIRFSVDGADYAPAKHVTHRGIMLDGLPNAAFIFGYIRSSWTLRANLVSTYICRLLDHMEDTGARSVTPVLRDGDADDPPRPWIDAEEFSAGYFARGIDRLPRQGARDPWQFSHDYHRDARTLPAARFDDGSLVFGSAREAGAGSARAKADQA